jgi:hypothetical protein
MDPAPSARESAGWEWEQGEVMTMSTTQHTSSRGRPPTLHADRLSGADLAATLCVATAVTVAVLWFSGVALTDWSTRLVAGVVLGLGYLGCLTTRSRMTQVYGAQGHRRVPLGYVVVSSLLGAAALLSGVVAVIWAARAPLVVLVATVVALWAMSTVRHLTTTPSSRPSPGQGRR